MRIKNKLTGQIFDVLPGTNYPDTFEEVIDSPAPIIEEKAPVDNIIEEIEAVEPVEVKKPAKKKKSSSRRKKGAKNGK